MLRKTFLKIILTILISGNWLFIMAQEDWIKVYGDERQNVAFEVVETYDKGYLLSCTIYDNTGLQVKFGLLIKTDINGEVLWEKKIGANPGPGKTGGGIVAQLDDGGFFITGTTYLYDNYGDAFILKLNACGEKEWSKIFYNYNSFEYVTGAIELDDSNYIVMIAYWGNDEANERIWLFKIGSDGEIIWQKVYAKWTLGTNAEEGRHLIKNNNNEYLITGDYYQYNPAEDTNARWDRPMFIKIDSLGNEIWHLLWGVEEYFYGVATKSVFDSLGNIYSVGQNDSGQQPGYQGTLFKLDENGNQIFFQNIPDSTNRGIATTLSLMQDSILLIGTSWADWDNNSHTSIYKTDTLGNILKEKELLQESNTFSSSIITSDNKYLVMGNFYMGQNWDIYLWKFNKDLEFDSIYTQPSVYDSLCPYQIVSDTIELDTTTVNLQELYEQMHQIKVRPNPASTKLIVTIGDLAKGNEIKLFNSNGQEVMQMNVFSARREYDLDVSGLPPGLYIVVLIEKGRVEDKEKIIITKK